MYENITLFQTSGALSKYASQRQAITATNIANSDTPGFQAKRLSAFTAEVDGRIQRQTRAGHMSLSPSTAAVTETTTGISPNGNSVSLELEMVESIESQRQHQRALTIYKHGLDILRTSLGRR
jgi:flagellar basal-body rod protein FlgB